MSDENQIDDDETEHFEMSFVLEQLDDGPARLVRTVETYSDGSIVQTEYEEALPDGDPYVLTRQRTVGEGPRREIVTEFLASPTRPRTYPAGFPFLAGRPCSTTESPAHARSEHACWRCDDPEVVLAALVEACLADGWIALPAASVEPFLGDNLAASFRRGNDMRLFHRLDHERGSAIRMMDTRATG
jgi:hypothetical protein